MSEPEYPRAAIYIDALGRKMGAMVVEAPGKDNRSQLVIGGHGITIRRARYSERCEPATWHWPPKPS